MIKSVVVDVVELAVKSSVYRKKHHGYAFKYLWKDWVELFVQGRPFLKTLDHKLGLLLDPEFVAMNRPWSNEVLKNQSVLSRRYFLDYLNLMGIWTEEEITMNWSKILNGSQVLALSVYDVYTSLNALPPPMVNMNNVQFGPVIGVLNGV